MTTGNPRSRAGWLWRMGGALAVLALAPATALAQGPAALLPPAPADTAPMHPSIALSDLQSAVPVTVLDRELLAATGTASLGQALQQLAWQSNAINTQFNNGGDGSTRISLRGLGAARTLVLVNGRRHVPGGTGADGSVDLESIPLALVERVEIVRGPAGGLGLGALAGVVNVVTRQDLDGAEAELFAGSTPDGLGQTLDASLALGRRFERGRVIVAAGYYRQQSLLGREREFGRSDHFYDWTTGEAIPSGSTATPQGTIQDHGEGQGNQAWQDLVNQNPGATTFYNDPEVGWRPFQPTGTSDTGEGDYYNYAPENYLVTPLARTHVFASGDYRLGEKVRAFAEASFVNRRSAQQLAAEPLFTVSEGVTVSADNVYNPFGRDFIDIRRRVVEADNRRSAQDIDTMRLVLGLDGTLPFNLGTPEPWRWVASYDYGVADAMQVGQGNLRRDRLQNALGPSFRDAEGTARCGTPESIIQDCVPLDLFGGPRTITPAMLDYLGHTSVSHGRNQQHRLAIEAGGELLRRPSGATLSLAIGADYRDEAGWLRSDPTATTGAPRIDLEGGYDVRAAHAVLSAVPFVDHARGQALVLQAAANAFDLATSGPGATWHVAGLARLGAGLSVRASQGRSMVAPGITALFSPATEGFPAVTDPCDTAFGPRSANVDANCRADGVPDDFVDARQQLRTLLGGNPELRPETADLRSAGIVFAPGLVPGLVLSADYFEIAVSDEATTLGAGHILQSCYDRAPDERSHCDRIVRDPATGAIDVINDTLANRGRSEMAGVDVQLAHDRETRLGWLRYHVGGTWLQKYETTGADGITVAGQGVYDLGVFPDYRLDGALLWNDGMLGAGAHLRYVGSFTECESNDCRAGNVAPELEPIAREVESYFTADVLGSLTLATGLGRTTITAGVRNLLDRQPPVIYNGFLGNSDASTYDFTGRFAYLRLSQQF